MTDIASIVRLLVLLLLIALIVIIVTSRLNVPYTLGLVVVGLVISFLGLIPNVRLTPELVLIVFLPALLFEGAWSTETTYLRKNWVHIFLLAGPGLLIAVILIALPLHFFGGLGWGPAFLLAAILSPTDCVAVLGLLRHLKVDDNLSSIIEGESLFNDGVPGALYQIFLALTLLSVHGQAITAGQAWLDSIFMFLLEAGGGAVLGPWGGVFLGWVGAGIHDTLNESQLPHVHSHLCN